MNLCVSVASASKISSQPFCLGSIFFIWVLEYSKVNSHTDMSSVSSLYIPTSSANCSQNSEEVWGLILAVSSAGSFPTWWWPQVTYGSLPILHT